MKKFLTYILLTVYLVFSTGWNINVHYCGGKLAGLGFSAAKMSSCCGDELVKKTSNCCKDEIKTFKSDENQQTSGNLRVHVPFFALIVQDIFLENTQAISPNCGYHAYFKQQHAPPSTVPLYLRNCVFTI